MNIQFKGTNYEPTPDITEMITKKLEGLHKQLGKQGELAQAYVVLAKTSAAHQNGMIWEAEINLSSNGQKYNAKSTREGIKPAVNACLAELTREVRHKRTRTETNKRKGGSKLKDWFRFGRS